MRLAHRGSRCRLTIVPLAATAVCVLASCGSAAPRRTSTRPHPGHGTLRIGAAVAPGRSDRRPGSGPKHGPFAVGLRVLHIVDHSRTIVLPGGARRPRPITTIVRYPAVGRGEVRDAPAARSAGPFPLVVFGHGFAVTPAIYSRLLTAWAAAGFVVAAPVFPLENAHAPGGPDERDLDNQPQDMRVVIDRLLGADGRAGGWAAGLIDRRRIAVAGQSDGGETAFALAYDRAFRDARVRAAVLLSGAQLPTGGRASLVAGGPPLLAVQGTADAINPPARTAALFAAVTAPKFLLTLIGASHLAPYTTGQPQLAIVERASVAFLRAYLGPSAGRRRALEALRRAANRPRLATLLARP